MDSLSTGGKTVTCNAFKPMVKSNDDEGLRFCREVLSARRQPRGANSLIFVF